jgi:hypothetical protein
MELKLIEIEPTELEFGSQGKFFDPKDGLVQAGPFDLSFGDAHLKEVRIGIVGTDEMINKAVAWFERCKSHISTSMKNIKQYPDYPGFENIFRAKIVVNKVWNYRVDEKVLNRNLAIKDNYQRFESVLQQYGEGVEWLANLENNRPNVTVCALPEFVLDSCGTIEKQMSDEEKRVARALIKAHRNKSGIQLSFFDKPIEDNVENLLYRDFRRALKAKAIQVKMPIQIGRDRLFLDLPDNQDSATRAWHSSVALYYKAGGIPWRMKNRGVEACFVGITFHHLKTNKRAIVKSCIAQGFSSEGEGFALRGGDIEESNIKKGYKDKTPHLSEEQAYDLGKKIIKEYAYRTGVNPQRIVLHKTSLFNEAEETGFRQAFLSIPIVELINILPTPFMLLKHSNYPVNRGTLCSVNDTYYLFNTGFIKDLKTYPGPHIPRPVEIRSNEAIDYQKASEDILALARMNWNTSSVTSGEPVTLFFSRQIGGIMSELNVKGIEDVPTSFRFYI